MQYIEAPSDDIAKFTSVFLGGGITNCPNWQAEVVNKLKDKAITLYNPRRKTFPINDSSAALQQIKWEYERLRSSVINSFWFPKESVCPIVLFEYGSALERDKPILIGMHPEYPRRIDVEIQTSLRNPNIKISYSLDDYIKEIERLADLR